MTTHTSQVDIRWGDCDPAGIVFFPRYFEMFDACTADLFRAVTGLHKRALLERYGIIGFPMVVSGARFMLPNRFGDRISVQTRAVRIGRSSFDIVHRVYRKDGELSVEANEKRVWSALDPQSSRIMGVPLPEELAKRLIAH